MIGRIITPLALVPVCPIIRPRQPLDLPSITLAKGSVQVTQALNPRYSLTPGTGELLMYNAPDFPIVPN